MVNTVNEFDKKLQEIGVKKLMCSSIQTIQINIGHYCNQTCTHCHVMASPSRQEMMGETTMKQVLEIASALPRCFIDITGGAPEYHPLLKSFISSLRNQDHQVQVRTNLTALLDDKTKDFPSFFQKQQVQLVASLPCYEEEEVRLQRGEGVFEKSIEALKKLNQRGYGKTSLLPLTLVFNPLHPVLPPEQAVLEQEYHRILKKDFGVVFTRLITLTNMPIGRFLQDLKRTHRAQQYIDLLQQSFNPLTLERLMCRSQINIGWDGTMYDCDFNLALHLPVVSKVSSHIQAFNIEKVSRRSIRTGNHCFGCTAGHGSSCGGSLV